MVKAWSPEYIKDATVSWGTKQANYTLRGGAPAYAAMRSQASASGRFMDAEDVRLRRRVAFLGSEVARELFGNVPPVGQRIRIRGMLFDVIGVQREKVQLSNYNSPDKECVFIPYTTAGELWDTEHLNNFVFQAMAPALLTRTIGDVRMVLGERLCFAPPRRARAAHVRRGRRAGDHQRHCARPDARDRRGRRHEHHVHVGDRTHA